MPKRPTLKAPKFGKWLQLRRGKRTLGQIATRVRAQVEDFGMKVNPSLIHKFEHGRVPGWPFLAAFSKVYGIPMTETTYRLIDALEFPSGAEITKLSDLLGQEGTQLSISGHGTPVAGVFDGGLDAAAAQARIRELEDDLDELRVYKSLVEELRPVLAHALDLVGTEGRSTRARKTASGGRHRKAH